ncbi:hypothetical protein SESBI_43293 [Sesbania bispinosa]|nr:hypothetical protein SESBI_43293 [Sesbania bispinosa]
MGFSFAAGTTDGPVAFYFKQGDDKGNPLWKMVRDLLKTPSKEQIDCQQPKPILLDIGEMKEPYGADRLPSMNYPVTVFSAERPQETLAAFLKTFSKDDDLKFFVNIMRHHSNQYTVEQMKDNSHDSPEQLERC